MTRKIFLLGTTFFLLATSPTAPTSPLWGGGDAFAADELIMTRIGARTERRQSTMEQRGDLRLDDPAEFFGGVTEHGITVGFYYTDTLVSDTFVPGDLMDRTNFTFTAEHCEAKGDDLKVLKCKDKIRKSYMFLKYKRNTGAYQMKTYIRKITCDLPPADCTDVNSGLTIDPGVGSHIDFQMDWQTIGGEARQLIGEMTRCDWKRGKSRTTKHVKCPTLCGGSPLAVCGTEFCEGSPACS